MTSTCTRTSTCTCTCMNTPYTYVLYRARPSGLPTSSARNGLLLEIPGDCNKILIWRFVTILAGRRLRSSVRFGPFGNLKACCHEGDAAFQTCCGAGTQDQPLGIARARISSSTHVIPANPAAMAFEATPSDQHVCVERTVPQAVLCQPAVWQPDLAWHEGEQRRSVTMCLSV